MSNGFHIESSTTRMDQGRRSNTLDEKKQALGSSNTFPGANVLNRNRSVTDLLAGLPKPPAWHEQGVCAQADPEAFYPEAGGDPKQAKRICATCDVQDVCLQWAMDNREDWGVWGGLTANERRAIRKQQRGAA